jgi:hypothetical protein
VTHCRCGANEVDAERHGDGLLVDGNRAALGLSARQRSPDGDLDARGTTMSPAYVNSTSARRRPSNAMSFVILETLYVRQRR